MRKFLTISLVGGALAAAGIASAQAVADPAGAATTVTRQQAQAQAAEVFGILDANRDGQLDQADRAAGARAVFDRIDTDRNGSISRAEFTAMQNQRGMAGRGRGLGRGRADGGRGDGGRGRGAGRADADGNGIVTRAEYDAAALARFDRADANDDGRVTLQERIGGRGWGGMGRMLGGN